MSKKEWASFISKWGPALLMMVIFFFASSIPNNNIPHLGRWDNVVRKTGHIIGYSLFALCLLRGLNRPGWKAILLALGLVLLYSLSDEFHQSFVAGRHSTPVDVAIDLSGAAAGVFFYQSFFRLHRFVLKGLHQYQSR